MRAVKGNREYTVSEKEKLHYQDLGFDILDDAGRVIAYGRGKTVPYADYEALKKENEVLMTELESLKKKAAAAEPIAAEPVESEPVKPARKIGK